MREMNILMKTNLSSRTLVSTTIVLLALAHVGFAAESAAERERKLIAILQSDAPPQDKAIPCKQLAIYGTKDAVPALAPLLANKDLASWARIALEAIPGPEADAALRDAVPKLNGLLLIGAMNSIGVRRDGKAVQTLAGKLSDSDTDVVSSAAAALGKIGGAEAAKVLNQALASASKQTASAVSEGAIVCAERFLTDGKFAEATQLYDAVRKADVPKQRWLEATRGAILARQSAGLPLLLEQLRSPERVEAAMALRTARELKGREVTEAIGAEIQRAGADREVMLLLALADRNDEAVFPRLLQAAEKGSKPSRVAALGLLDRYTEPSVVPVLLNAAGESDTDVATPAKATLARMENKTVDSEILKRLPDSTGRNRQMLIELAALRRIEGAVPVVVASVKDSDPGVRRAALSTLSAIGSEKQIADMVTLLSNTKEADREPIEQALAAMSGRAGARSLPHVMPLAKNSDAELRKVALRTFATIGGSEALAAVNSAVEDSDESVRDEAVGTLATWPNNWPDDTAVAEPLMSLIKSGKKRSYQVQGVRGYLLHIQENKKLSNSDKLKAIDDLLPFLRQPAEKRLAISALGSIPTAKTLDSLAALADDPAVADEASLAIVNVATARGLDASKDARQKALQMAMEKSKSDATKKKAGDALKALQ